MDDNVQQVAGNTVQVTEATQDDSQYTVTVPAPQATRPVQQPGISGPKEHEPIASAPAETPVEVIVKSTEQAPEISKELKEMGVDHSHEVKEQEPPVQVKVAPAPASPAPQSQPVQATAQFGMTYAQALAKVKASPIRDSVRWLAAEIIRQLKRLQ